MINLDKSSFIGARMLPTRLCDDIVNYYKNNPKIRYEGTVINSAGVFYKDDDHKISNEIFVQKERFDKPFGEYREELQLCLNDYQETYPDIGSLAKFNVYESYNIQYYPPGGGFKKRHFERNGCNLQNIKRCLVFMTYLNDVDDGGTEFMYQDVITPAVKGLTLIWPADWTHTHRGVISKTKEKYIITGWFSYLWGNKKDYVWTE
jgi:prolyl 4-hydroxylase